MTLLAVLLLVRPAAAEFPDRPLRILGGFAAGGTSDLVARIVAEAVSPGLGQRVVVENRTGASGMIAAEAMVRAPHDGYTVFQCASLVTVLPELPGMRLPVDTWQDMVPVANVAHSNQAMVVKASAPWRNVAEFIAAARARPGALTYASSGIGALSHLSGARLEQLAGIRMVHVRYRGAALGVVDVMGGRADTIITNLGDVVGQVRGGELRLLGFADGIGSPLFPDVPQIKATVPGYEISGWFGICGPRDMPAEALERWQRAIGQALAEPQWQRRLQENGLIPRFEDPAAFARTMQQDRQVWRETIRAANIRVE
jgi:tripartite-type tricarboxylate transporter receptor subunit TctC